MMRNIRKRLDAIGLKAGANNAKWTAAIKTELCSLGREFDFWVYASGCGDIAHGGEYLYDVTWLDYEGDLLTSASLVAECEWNNLDYIDEDFQKLLFPRADIRLMVFDGSHKPYTHDIMEHLAKQIRHFRHSCDSDSWLFAAWESDEGSERGWRFRWYTIRRGEPLLLQP